MTKRIKKTQQIAAAAAATTSKASTSAAANVTPQKRTVSQCSPDQDKNGKKHRLRRTGTLSDQISSMEYDAHLLYTISML